MDPKDREKTIIIRDDLNRETTPFLRDKYPNIKKGQDKMNYYFNLEIDPPPPPPPPPTKPKLDPKKVYKADGKHKLVCPFLIPSFGINRRIKEEDAMWLVDKFAQRGWGNFMRLFVAGNWEPYWQQENRIWFPYLKEKGKFNLNKKNPKHFECLFRRAGYLAERDIMPMFTLLDNCSTHIGRPGFWNTNWMNGNRNINGTHNEAYSLTHWYEYNGLPPHSNPDKKREGMRETGEILMDLYGYVLDEAKKRCGDFFLIEIGNEIPARINYHYMLRKLIDERLGGNNNFRVFTSMYHDKFYQVSVGDHCIPILHGIATIKDFERRRQYVELKEVKDKDGNITYVKRDMVYGLSNDGENPLTSNPTKEVVKYILIKTKSILFEGQVRPILEWEDNKWVNVCGKEDWTFRSLRFGLCKAFGEAFEEHLG